VKSCSRQRRPTGGSQQPAPQGARSRRSVWCTSCPRCIYAVAAGEQHHAPREPEGPWPTSSPARALCWLAAVEQQRAAWSGLRRTSRSPTASSVSSSLASWGSVVAFATTECHLEVDGRQARALSVHQNIRTPHMKDSKASAAKAGPGLDTQAQ
jgi:hypothetical protein